MLSNDLFLALDVLNVDKKRYSVEKQVWKLIVEYFRW